MTSQNASPNPDVESDTDSVSHQQHQHPHDQHPQETHLLQAVLDNPWILLALGLLIPFISYTAWGWIELSFIEAAQLP